MTDRQSHQKSDHDCHSRAHHFMPGDLVMAKNYRLDQTGFLQQSWLDWDLSLTHLKQLTNSSGDVM